MAYNLELEQHIDVITTPWPGIEKKKMFGGLGYLINGHMAFGIHKNELVVRLGCATKAADALCQPHINPFDITGKPMRGWVMVSPAGWEDEAELNRWLREGRACAESLEKK